ncbi:hypothetical protein B0H12DRAFT_1077382 [Mycena haematopus]|nr:hypothetical protein B0H12DRAFT_1077382 [Mycena haematopus]
MSLTSIGSNKEGRIGKADTFVCVICSDTMWKPVMTLCLHYFCYNCLKAWILKRGAVCPTCDVDMLEAPIRDNGFEIALNEAISASLMKKPVNMKGKNSADAEDSYSWEGIRFFG